LCCGKVWKDVKKPELFFDSKKHCAAVRREIDITRSYDIIIYERSILIV
jgi:hypothetical protein